MRTHASNGSGVAVATEKARRARQVGTCRWRGRQVLQQRSDHSSGQIKRNRQVGEPVCIGMDGAYRKKVNAHDEVGGRIITKRRAAHRHRLSTLQDQVDHRRVDRRQRVLWDFPLYHGNTWNAGVSPPVLCAGSESTEFGREARRRQLTHDQARERSAAPLGHPAREALAADLRAPCL